MPPLTFLMPRQVPFEKKVSNELLKHRVHVGVFQEQHQWFLGFLRDCHLLFSHVYNSRC